LGEINVSDPKRILALTVAALFVIVFLPVLSVSTLARLVADREAAKVALNGEVLLDEAAAVLIREGLRHQAVLDSLPALVRDSERLQIALDELVPADWATGQTDAIVDAIYNYLETGDESFLTLSVETAPLFAALQGEPGRNMMLAILEGLPPCTLDNLPSIDLGAGTFDITACMPPLVPLDLVADSLHGIVRQVINEETAAAVIGERFEFSLLDLDPTTRADTLRTLGRLRQFYLWSRIITWLLWLIPILCLLVILALAIRSPGNFGLWWGWPLVAAAGLSLVMLALLFPPLLNLIAERIGQPAAGAGAGAVINRLLQIAFEAMSEIWLARMRLQAGLALIVGLFLVAFGFIGTWMFSSRPKGAPLFDVGQNP
jgi:hypothetical protein